MSNFSYFMKANKKVKENVFHPVTASLCDANGKPLDWEFRHITSKENDEIREDCTKEIPVTGKPNLYRPMWTVASTLRNCLSSPLSPPICTMSNFRTATA